MKMGLFPVLDLHSAQRAWWKRFAHIYPRYAKVTVCIWLVFSCALVWTTWPIAQAQGVVFTAYLLAVLPWSGLLLSSSLLVAVIPALSQLPAFPRRRHHEAMLNFRKYYISLQLCERQNALECLCLTLKAIAQSKAQDGRQA